MNSSICSSIKEELHNNPIFKVILDNFSLPILDNVETNLDLAYESNEYMGYYKKDFYFDLVPRENNNHTNGILKLTFVSSNKHFDIDKAMHLTPSDDTNIVSATFKIYGDNSNWDIIRYSYTLWK